MMKFWIVVIALAFVGCSNDTVVADHSEKSVESSIVAASPEENGKVTNSDTLKNKKQEEKIIPTPSSPYSTQVFEHDNGWGYQLFEEKQLLIHQEHIPSIPGVKGFSSREKAEIAANFILKEVEKGVFPPTVTPKILDSLGVL